MRIVLNVSFVLSGINHAGNFFIYIISSPRFRQLFLAMLPFRTEQTPGAEAAAKQAMIPVICRQQRHAQQEQQASAMELKNAGAESARDIYVHINLQVYVRGANESTSPQVNNTGSGLST